MSSTNISMQVRLAVLQRADSCCEYCRNQARYSSDILSIDHIVPRSGGGADSIDNLALACQTCNNYKASRIVGLDPYTDEIVPLYNPRQSHWPDHFIWNEGYILIIGTTPTGRATIVTLKMNRSSLINLREVLRVMKKHPPELVKLNTL